MQLLDRPRVAAVVVTWQRLELLQVCLAAVTGQTRPPDVVVVVDNASGDGTADAVRQQWPQVDLVVLRCNTGGAGGFAAGLQRAREVHGADLVWLLDDDTVPDPPALAELVRAWADHPGRRPALVASRARWVDGRDHPMNTPRPWPLSSPAARRAAHRVGCVPVRTASVGSVLLDARVVDRVGLPVADYFLWNDDFEYTARLLRGEAGLLCAGSEVEHRTRTFGDSDADPGPRFYYEVRNKLWTLLRSPGLGPLERLLYSAATARRWCRAVRSSPDRRTLLRAGRDGLRDGLTTRPRATSDVLREAWPPAG